MSRTRTRETLEVENTPAKRVPRHLAIDRIYHWTMAASLLVCLFTAFLPILGWKFEWLTSHWIAGVVLTIAVLFHIVRAVLFQDFWAMVPGSHDLVGVWRRLRLALGGDGAAPLRAAKYPLMQKLFHALVAALVLAIVVTGLLMLSKIDTALWRRNPYWLGDGQWGVVYTIHGMAAMAMITLTMAHIYFAVRPDKWWMSRSMFVGWISRADYEKHHDPQRWKLPGP
jgi:cytochrome b subunit of formate dehydrogenase